MQTYYFLIPISILMGGLALGTFFWSLRADQYEDLDGAAERVLLEEESDMTEHSTKEKLENSCHRS